MSIHVCTLLYTHVYTTVYTRVHKCALSISCSRARLYVYPLGIMPRIFSDGLRLPEIGNDTPEDPKAGVERARSYGGPEQ